jgi:hypothetical protein
MIKSGHGSNIIIKHRFSIVSLLVALAIVVSAPAVAYADTSGIGGKPANPDPSNSRTKTIFIKTVKPGQFVEDAVSVSNNSSSVKTITVYSTDSVISSGGAFACAQAAEPPMSVGKWIAVSKENVEVPANSTVIVPFTITAPLNAEPGEQDGCIVLQEMKAPSVQGGISLSFRTAIRVAVLIPGEINKNIETTEIAVTSRGDKIIVSPTVKSTSNVSIDATITTRIKSVIGTTIAQHEDMFPVLRNQEASWNFEFNRPYWGGLYIASYDVSYDKGNTFIGGTNAATDTATVRGPVKVFISLPSASAALIEFIILLAAAGAIVWYRINKLHKKSVDEKWVDYTISESDQIQEVAALYGISWKLLARANRIKAPYTLVAGENIKVPHTLKKAKKPSKKRVTVKK